MGNNIFESVSVLPKPARKLPVVLYAHGSGNSLMTDGNDLRQLAEMGLATVSLEYDQTNLANFDAQFTTLLDYIARQKWANTNAIAWVGSSLGANLLRNFIQHHPEHAPQLLILVSGEGLPGSVIKNNLSLPCPTLLLHGSEDQIFTTPDLQRLAATLQSNQVSVELKMLPGAPHDLEPDRKLVFRELGEYILVHFAGTNALPNYYSIARYTAAAPPLWLFLLPALFWLIGCYAWYRRHRPTREKIILNRWEIGLRWLTIILATGALVETALHLVPPHLAITSRTLRLARKIIVPPKMLVDFDIQATNAIWPGKPLKTLLEQVELANYTRNELVNWQTPDDLYHDYILSPLIDSSSSSQLQWRRDLWEEFYPRVRHENQPAEAASIVIRHLRERVTIAPDLKTGNSIPKLWQNQITDARGFELLYVAALRSVSVASRLDANGQAEFWTGDQWQAAPRPLISSLLTPP